MKDAYSFDRDAAGLATIYEKMRQAYEKILQSCGLNFISIKADSGVIGGDVSHEFMVPAESGEDIVYRCNTCHEIKGSSDADIDACPHCKADMEKLHALEVGHIFQLGEKYSKALNVKFLDEKGEQKIVQMGCYGIGVSRLIAAVIEQNNDADGIIWPAAVAPYHVLIVPVNVSDKEILDEALALHVALEKSGLEVLVDDRDERAGVKFKDADLLGIPVRVTIGNKWLKAKSLEVRDRRSKETKEVSSEQVLGEVRRLLLAGDKNG
jgi:prolyl-tRNA synthetase